MEGIFDPVGPRYVRKDHQVSDTIDEFHWPLSRVNRFPPLDLLYKSTTRALQTTLHAVHTMGFTRQAAHQDMQIISYMDSICYAADCKLPSRERQILEMSLNYQI